MSRTKIAAVIGAGAMMLAATTAQAGPIRHRQVNQRARIHQGVQNDSLTRGETRVLNREQRAIDSGRRRAVSDGHIGPREARALTRAQNRASRTINRLKHNGRVAR